jgi:hypothetical protein
MNRSIASAVLLCPFSVFLSSAAYAVDSDRCFTQRMGEGKDQLDKEPALCSYEPNTVGFTKDSDDVLFMDFKLSVRYQMYPFPKQGGNWATFFAATVRMGQYIGTRDSSPVIAKRFNPKIFVRTWDDGEHSSYWDFGYNHESNGQAIHTLEQYNAAQAEQQSANGHAEYANDYISRGWDFLEVIRKHTFEASKTSESTGYLTLKYFLPRGIFQGKPEEYGTNFPESDPQGKPRNQVNGIGAIYKYRESDAAWCLTNNCKVAATYDTGYHKIARYNTVRLEYGFKLEHLPLTIWGQTGYGSDLAQYYKKVSSYGFELEIGSF